ncbi:hypothetical protein BFC22_11660 [Carnobacterium divergens]|uniref:hypothetical protein n=1 Tax=Carnobacterium divergens TaxID=2748 RepID=UPI000E71534A|nr:hypothetical protein [Carnobacterium divergens]AOA00701.1 hypothetical protein BFC22_11660 [Carnobacterium divergens]
MMNNSSSSTSTKETSKEELAITIDQATKIAMNVAEDFKKNIIGTFEDIDTSNSWGSTVSMTFNEDNTILMTETDSSFQKINLTYEEYVSFMDSYQSSMYENKYLPVDIKTTIKGYMSRDINEEKNTEANLSCTNFKLEMSSNTSIFKNAGQPSLIKK